MGSKTQPERWIILSNNGGPARLIATIENGQFGDTLDTERHTAHLFAAAPDVLEALQCLTRAEERRLQYNRVNPDDDTGDHIEMAIAEALDKARTAIAKSEGRAVS